MALNPFRTAKFQQQGKVYDEAEERYVYKPPARITIDEERARRLLTEEGFERFLRGAVIRPKDFKTAALAAAAAQLGERSIEFNPHSDWQPVLWAVALLIGIKAFNR